MGVKKSHANHVNFYLVELLRQYQAYKKGYLIVTDDLSFASYLNNISIKNISSAHLITALVKKDKISKQEAYYYLEKLKLLIRREVYELVKKDIEGEEK